MSLENQLGWKMYSEFPILKSSPVFWGGHVSFQGCFQDMNSSSTIFPSSHHLPIFGGPKKVQEKWPFPKLIMSHWKEGLNFHWTWWHEESSSQQNPFSGDMASLVFFRGAGHRKKTKVLKGWDSPKNGVSWKMFFRFLSVVCDEFRLPLRPSFLGRFWGTKFSQSR